MKYLNKKYLFRILLIGWLVSFYFFFPRIKEIIIKYQKIDFTGDITDVNIPNDFTVDTGSSATSSGELNIDNVTGVKLKHFDILKIYSKDHFRYFNPGKQPTTIPVGYSYSQRSDLLNQYLKENTKNINIPGGISTGYLFVKLNKPTKSKIFLYWYGDKTSGYLDVSKSLEHISDRAYIFYLNNIPLHRYVTNKFDSYDRQYLLNQGKSQFIGGYVTSFDGTQIEEIIIARE